VVVDVFVTSTPPKGTVMPSTLRRSTKRALIAGIAGLSIGGGVLASAASLGVTGNTLGAGTSVIASCDTDGVSLAYTNSYVGGTGVGGGTYRTSAVVISGIAAACAGKPMSVTLRDSGNVSLGSGTIAAIVGTSSTVSFGATPWIDASAVVGAAVVISD
jgi:hypothetical protein